MKSQNKNTNVEPQASEEGGSWQFKLILIVIALGLIGLVGKAMGLF